MTNNFFVNKLGQYEDRACLIAPDNETISYRKLIERADAVARALGKERQFVFIEGNNSVAAIISYVGCLRGGHVVHLLDPDKKYENDYLISTYKPNVIIRSMNMDWSIERIHNESVMLHSDLCILLSTSGSTGSMKLVKLSYQNIQSNTDSIIEYLHMNKADRAISSLKFYYSYGMSIINTHLSVGGSIVLTDIPIQESKFWNIFRSHNVTSFSGVPYSFQILEQSDIDFSSFPSLRVITQAGGKLAPHLIRKYARLGAKQKWLFYVMYGQTEASPRISYLPPDLAEENQDCIGIAIPNGHLSLVSDNGQLIDEYGQEGELVYSGPNVMIGYAYTNTDLATNEAILQLFTGDLAVITQNGLFRIVGRKSRFVKPFGIRFNLDDVENYLSTINIRALVVGDDNEILVYVEESLLTDDILIRLSDKYDFPSSFFHLRTINLFPVLPNGKFDYRALEKISWDDKSDRPNNRISFCWLFFKKAFHEFCSLFVGDGCGWSSVEEIFTIYFPKSKLFMEQSFFSLGGDSLIYVEMSICLEEYLEELPSDWHNMTIRELQEIKWLHEK